MDDGAERAGTVTVDDADDFCTPHQFVVQKRIQVPQSNIRRHAVKVDRGCVSEFGGENQVFNGFHGASRLLDSSLSYGAITHPMEDPLLDTERLIARTFLTPRQRRWMTPLFFVIVMLVGWYTTSQRPKTAPPIVPPVVSAVAATTTASNVTVSSTVQTNAFVVRAVDGDTLDAVLDGETVSVKIRLLGVNTPESVDPRRAVECFGKEASHFTASSTAQKRVRLVADPEADERDKYGRLLRNMILEDGTDFNAILVREGYAYAYISFPQNKQRKAELVRWQKEAEAAKRGLWNPQTCNGLK